MSATISATVTIALSMKTPIELIVTVTLVPSNVVTTWLFDNIPDITLDPTTWCFKISVNWGMSASNAANVPDGNKLNAASVGANNVNDPGSDKTPFKAQASIATFSVVWSEEFDTIS